MSVRAGVLLAFAAPMLAACASLPEVHTLATRADAPVFDPFTFFVGESRGTGTLSKLMADDTPIRVESRGRIVEEASREAAWASPPRRVLVIDQTIHEGENPPRTRQWRIEAIAPGRYEGTLSDAVSPVRGQAEGNRLVLEYRMKGSVPVRQELTLSPDGRRAHNVMTVKQLGATVAMLAEDIVRTP